MQTLALTILIFAVSGAGLGLGLFFGRPPVKGSCGGLNCQTGGGCAGCSLSEQNR